jgi:hypothetical protein
MPVCYLSSSTTVLHTGVGVVLGRSDCAPEATEFGSGLVDRVSRAAGGSRLLERFRMSVWSHSIDNVVSYSDAFVEVVKLPDLVGGSDTFVINGRVAGFRM